MWWKKKLQTQGKEEDLHESAGAISSKDCDSKKRKRLRKDDRETIAALHMLKKKIESILLLGADTDSGGNMYSPEVLEKLNCLDVPAELKLDISNIFQRSKLSDDGLDDVFGKISGWLVNPSVRPTESRKGYGYVWAT